MVSSLTACPPVLTDMQARESRADLEACTARAVRAPAFPTLDPCPCLCASTCQLSPLRAPHTEGARCSNSSCGTPLRIKSPSEDRRRYPTGACMPPPQWLESAGSCNHQQTHVEGGAIIEVQECAGQRAGWFKEVGWLQLCGRGCGGLGGWAARASERAHMEGSPIAEVDCTWEESCAGQKVFICSATKWGCCCERVGPRQDC